MLWFGSQNGRKEVLCVVHNTLMFTYLEPVIERLAQDSRLRLRLCFNMQHRLTKTEMRQMQKSTGLAAVALPVAQKAKWDLILCADHAHGFRSDAPIIHMGHGLPSGKRLENNKCHKYCEEHTVLDGKVIYEKMLAASEEEQRTVPENYPHLAGRIKACGSLLMDAMVDPTASLDRVARLDQLGMDPGRKTVVFISSWAGESLAQHMGPDPIKYIFPLLETYNVIFSLHPNSLRPTYLEKVNWLEIAEDTNAPNLHIIADGTTSELLPLADAIVTDHSAAALYYLHLARPVVFFDNPQLIYDDWAHARELRDRAYTIKAFDNLESDLQAAMQNFDPKPIKELADRVCSHVGEAWGRYEAEMYDTLRLPAFSSFSQEVAHER